MPGAPSLTGSVTLDFSEPHRYGAHRTPRMYAYRLDLLKGQTGQRCLPTPSHPSSGKGAPIPMSEWGGITRTDAPSFQAVKPELSSKKCVTDSTETFDFLSNYRSTTREQSMVEYVAISVIALVFGFVLGYAVRAAISARKRRKASRYDARQSWADARRSS